MDNRLKNIEKDIPKIMEQLKDVPKRVCRIEETTEKLVLRGFYEKEIKPSKWYYFPNDNEEIICEDGVIHEYFLGELFEVLNRGNETKLCMIKTKKEVCEIKWINTK